MPRKRKQDQDGLYRRPDSPKWWATYTDANGKRVRCSTGTAERQEADALLAKWKLEAHRERQWDEAPPHGFDELMVVYLTRLWPFSRPGTRHPFVPKAAPG
ncbi:hypothetical protein [uncultured Thiocystis sp.]|jgi:hypothetical protein|uniref:hypothetical protein n=1 Tax=uncultured Thiocystis sp. TaxID=1202134 RepID=UPI0025CD95AF|nr:hypothetical protein [uncultured Thiocystis sp.]